LKVVTRKRYTSTKEVYFSQCQIIQLCRNFILPRFPAFVNIFIETKNATVEHSRIFLFMCNVCTLRVNDAYRRLDAQPLVAFSGTLFVGSAHTRKKLSFLTSSSYRATRE